jgi:hypothetical protein
VRAGEKTQIYNAQYAHAAPAQIASEPKILTIS